MLVHIQSVQRLIIDPLHLTSARYDPAPQITGPHADGYFTYPNGTYKDLTAYTEGLAANGGIVSDAADEAHFLQALMRGQVLKPAQLTALETAYSTAEEHFELRARRRRSNPTAAPTGCSPTATTAAATATCPRCRSRPTAAASPSC